MAASFLPSTSQAQALLTPPSTDQSVGILNKLFGTTDWHAIYMHSIGFASGGSVFFHLLSAFDIVVFAFVTLVSVYVVSVNVVSHAHAGEAHGNHHVLWTPLRSAMAMLMLAPIPGVGISLVQGLLLFFVYLSIGGGNYLANQAIDFMISNPSAMATSVTLHGGKQLAEDIVQSEYTQQFFVDYESPATGAAPSIGVFTGGPVWHGDLLGSAGKYVYTFTTPSGLASAMGGDGILGSITIPCHSQNGPMCQSQVAAVQQMAQTLAAWVGPFVNSTMAAPGSNSGSTTNRPAAQPPAGAVPIQQAVAQYDATIQAGAQQEASQRQSQIAASTQGLQDTVRRYGWFSLGSYYWAIAHVDQKLQARVDEAPAWSGYNAGAVQGGLSRQDRARFTGTMKNMADGYVAATASPHEGLIATAENQIWHSRAPWYAIVPADLLLKGDPIHNLQQAGNVIMDSEGFALTGYIAARTIAKAGSREANNIPGVSELFGAAAGIPQSVLKYLSPYMLGAFLALTTLGAVWAYYLPAVPFIIWTFEIVGWVILIVEALPASALWAAGVSLPEGEGLIGPRGEQGVMLFMENFMRPALMVLGFFASFLVLDTLGNAVGGAFALFAGHEGTQGFFTRHNPLTWFAQAALVTIIAVMLSHKIFSLIHHIPENVMRWINGAGRSLGGQEAHGEARQMFAGFAASRGKTVGLDAMSGSSPGGQAGKGGGGAAGAKAAGAGMSEEIAQMPEKTDNRNRG